MGARAMSPTFAVWMAGCSLITSTNNLVGTKDAAEARPLGSDASASETSGAPDAADGSAAPTDVSTKDAPRVYADEVLLDAPAFYFPFDEPTGSAFAKDRVRGATADVVGNVTFGSQGIAGTAVTFSRSGSLRGPDIFDIIGTAPFTIEVWTKPPPCPCVDGQLIDKRDEATSPFNGWVLYIHEDLTVQFEIWGVDASRSAWGPTSATAYSHVVLTYDGASDMRLYIDSIRQQTAYAGQNGAADNVIPFEIGPNFAGAIDELALYDHPLSTERVRAHFEAGR